MKTEIWRVYGGDTALLTTKNGRTIKITLAEDKSHAIVEFDKAMWDDANAERDKGIE